MKTQSLTLLAALALMACSSRFEGKDLEAPSLGGGADSGLTTDDADADGGLAPEDADADNDGVSIADGDCDDENDGVYPRFDGTPGATDICDGIDNDCDGIIDEGFSKETYFIDQDGDGYGDKDVEVETCEELEGYVQDDTDCDDDNENTNPGAPEIVGDGIDNDCDGDEDERFDIEVVETEDGFDIGDPSIVRVDGAGRAHIVAHDSSTGEVVYLQVNTEGEMTEDTVLVADSNFDGAYLDAELDVDGTLHIGYTSDIDYGRGIHRSLWYVTRTASGMWSSPALIDGSVTGELERGQYVDLAIHRGDFLGNTPSFAYLNGDHSTPMLADVLMAGTDPLVFAMGTSYLEGFTGVPSGTHTTMDIDQTGRQHVAFFDPNADFSTAPQIQYTDFLWNPEALLGAGGSFGDLLPEYGDFESTVIEANATDLSLRTRHEDNVPCIAYQDVDARDLMLTCREADGWANETVYATGLTGAEPALLINGADEMFISFYDEGTKDLMLAIKRKEAAWEIITVDAEGDVGRASSVAFGPDGRLHISYYDNSQNTVRYAVGF
jgi:hypothetical protein